MIVELINNKTNCKECQCWNKIEVKALVDFLSQTSRPVFLKAAEAVVQYPQPVTPNEIIEFFIGSLTQEQQKYQSELTQVAKLLNDLMESIAPQEDYNDIRGAIVESFVAKFLFNEFVNHKHHCLIKIDDTLVDAGKSIDVAGWENENHGEFHECKAKWFNYRFDQNKYQFLKNLKSLVGVGNIVAVSVFGKVEPRVIDDYAQDGIIHYDRSALAEKFLPL
jgi:hypothetical protein